MDRKDLKSRTESAQDNWGGVIYKKIRSLDAGFVSEQTGRVVSLQWPSQAIILIHFLTVNSRSRGMTYLSQFIRCLDKVRSSNLRSSMFFLLSLVVNLCYQRIVDHLVDLFFFGF